MNIGVTFMMIFPDFFGTFLSNLTDNPLIKEAVVDASSLYIWFAIPAAFSIIIPTTLFYILSLLMYNKYLFRMMNYFVNYLSDINIKRTKSKINWALGITMGALTILSYFK